MEERIREHYIRKYSLITAVISFLVMISTIAGECIYTRNSVTFDTSADTLSEFSPISSGESSITSEEISNLITAINTLDNDVNLLTEALEQTTELARIELEEPEEIYSEVDDLNIYEGVGEETDIITSIDYGTKMLATAYIITSEEEEWAEISTADGTPQFVNTSYTTTDNPNVKYIGDYYLTYYCPCAQCCGTANNPTASGTMPKVNHTVAADSSLAFGTKLIINGTTYTVEDRGSGVKGNHIDIFCATHEDALNHKTETVPVYEILESNTKSYF
jgi:3D (Asp-Asp-Asp) domain-containing protein